MGKSRALSIGGEPNRDIFDPVKTYRRVHLKDLRQEPGTISGLGRGRVKKGEYLYVIKK